MWRNKTVLLTAVLSLAVRTAGAVEPAAEYSGEIDNELVKALPNPGCDTGFVADKAAFSKLWTAWSKASEPKIDFAKLKEFTNLTHLYLNNNQVTDRGLANLSHLTGLYQLYLGNNPGVTDAGMKHLKDIMTARIQILGIDNTQVTEVGLKQLQDWSGQQKNDIGPTQINHSIVAPKVYE